MSAFRRIVAATDFSEAGDAAVGRALALGAAAGGRVVVCHVLELPEPPNPLYAHYGTRHSLSAEELEQMRAQARRALEERVPAARAGGDAPTLEVRAGRPVQEILAALEEHDADLVVVGGSGRSALSRTFLGSVTDRLVHHAPCSFLVVRPPGGH